MSGEIIKSGISENDIKKRQEVPNFTFNRGLQVGEMDIDRSILTAIRNKKLKSRDMLLLCSFRADGINPDDLQIMNCQDRESSIVKTIVTPVRPIIFGNVHATTKSRLIEATKYVLNPHTSWRYPDPTVILAARELIMAGLDLNAEDPDVEINLPIQIQVLLGVSYLQEISKNTAVSFVSRLWQPYGSRLDLSEYLSVHYAIKPLKSHKWHFYSITIGGEKK